MPRKRKVKTPRGVVGFAYVGTWPDGQLGWAVPNYIEPGRTAEMPLCETWTRGATFYRCRVTIEPIVSSSGRVTTRRIPKEEPDEGPNV
jgi:hypothetical protein